MNLQAAPDYFELADYTSVLRRRWKSIAVLALAGIALAAAYLVVGPAIYTGTVSVQVNALPNNANAVGGRTGGGLAGGAPIVDGGVRGGIAWGHAAEQHVLGGKTEKGRERFV